MKALEMLYRDKKWIEEECDIYKIPIERVHTTIKDLVEINEAIAELEAKDEKLQQLDDAYASVVSDFESAVMELAKKDEHISHLQNVYTSLDKRYLKIKLELEELKD